MAVKISIRPNGPYLVEGEFELVDVNVPAPSLSRGTGRSSCTWFGSSSSPRRPA
jgi:hypothetical protein